MKSGNRKFSILIIGSGGREHALGWKLAQSPLVKETFFAPGNGGTPENLDIQPGDVDKLVSFAKRRRSSCLTVVGPEDPLSQGIVDAFVKEDLKIIGPTRDAAMLETSKEFSKGFMIENNIPTADFSVFGDPEKAKDFVVRQKKNLVIKADGLAAGKGVAVCDNTAEAISAIENIMVRKVFGPAGNKVVIEERLFGDEVSFIALCDGSSIIPFASSQDYKRIFDNDTGPNTGGMGAYSPAPVLNDKLQEEVLRRVMKPAIQGMKTRGRPFKGFLYAGIMIEKRTREPFVLEFNARMGDPECQSIMMRLDSDLFHCFDAAAEERLDKINPIHWKEQHAACVVMAAKGYPGNYDTEKGRVIKGLDSIKNPNIMVFHSGTARRRDGNVVINGGRVLGVTALGEDLKVAITNAYSAVKQIHWGNNDEYFRTDIGKRGLRLDQKQ